MESTSIGAVKRGLNSAFPATSSLLPDSPNCALAAAGGLCEYTSAINLTNNGATHQNLFTITGAVRLIQIWGVVTAVTDSTSFADVDFDVYDGTTATVMTTATDCSGIVAKDLIAKMGGDGVGITFLNSATAAYYEGAVDKKAFGEGIITESSAGTTYVRLGYTGDATSDYTLQFFLRWQPMCTSANVTAS